MKIPRKGFIIRAVLLHSFILTAGPSLSGLKVAQEDLLFAFASSMNSLSFPNLSQCSRFMAVNMEKEKYKTLLQILFRSVIFILKTAL